MIAWRAPSAVLVTPADGGRGSTGSVPKVTVWLIEGSRLVHSTVSPTRTMIKRGGNRIRDAVDEPAPDVVSTIPTPAAAWPDSPCSALPLRREAFESKWALSF